ncbi:MAG: DUF839 domain-containing protein [Verrucomicrobiota bacterium]|nr:DUF839 domain-containing protein [Verrucomicrobiota bacterium]
MKHLFPGKREQYWAALLAAPILAGAAVSAQADNNEECFLTQVKPYAVSYSTDYVVKPLLSVGEQLPSTKNASQVYQLVGIPDGLGVHKAGHNNVAVYMNHEFGNTVVSTPYPGLPSYRGAFVSRLMLNRDGCVLSGDVAYTEVVDHEKGLVLPPAQVGNTTPGFARFCSGSLSWKEAGFDRPIYFCGEESGGAATFDGKGGLGVCVFDNQLHTLPWQGRFPWENTLARPHPGETTVLMMMEDGPNTPDNQLYMWVGKKNKKASDGLGRNGLGRDDGGVWVLIGDDASKNSELTFTSGSITAHWVKLEGVEAMTDAQLEVASDAVGAFGFIRTEDGAFDKKDPNIYYFVTTGGGTGNSLGRLYKLELNKKDVTGPCKLTLIYNADEVIAAGGDIAISPDNVETIPGAVLICEDGTAQSRAVMSAKGRDGQIWSFDIKNNYEATPIVELNPPGTVRPVSGNPPVLGNPPAITAGVWETSGIVSTEGLLGNGTLLFDVQAHLPSLAPGTGTVEDGQLLLLIPTRGKDRGDDRD